MNPFYFVIGAFVLTIAWFRMDVLIRPRPFRIVLLISITLAVAGLILHVVRFDTYLSAALLCPLVTLLLFRSGRAVFVASFKRDPKDTFLDLNADVGRDHVFNVLYFILGALIVIFLPLAMRQLTKAGW